MICRWEKRENLPEKVITFGAVPSRKLNESPARRDTTKVDSQGQCLGWLPGLQGTFDKLEILFANASEQKTRKIRCHSLPSTATAQTSNTNFIILYPISWVMTLICDADGRDHFSCFILEEENPSSLGEKVVCMRRHDDSQQRFALFPTWVTFNISSLMACLTGLGLR